MTFVIMWTGEHVAGPETKWDRVPLVSGQRLHNVSGFCLYVIIIITINIRYLCYWKCFHAVFSCDWSVWEMSASALTWPGLNRGRVRRAPKVKWHHNFVEVTIEVITMVLWFYGVTLFTWRRSYPDNSCCHQWLGCEWLQPVSWPPHCIQKVRLLNRDIQLERWFYFIFLWPGTRQKIETRQRPVLLLFHGSPAVPLYPWCSIVLLLF